MTIFLRQSTANQKISLGLFVDNSDGYTAETGLTIANTDIKIWKFGATSLANKNSGGATHMTGGAYYAVLDATDTDTSGSMTIYVNVSGALPVQRDCVVLNAVVYDSMIAATDSLQVEVTSAGTDAITADAISSAAGNKIADHTLRRAWSSAAASANGDAKSFRSLLGAVAKLVNRLAISGTTLTIYESDDSTSLGSQALTTSTSATPITQADTN